MGKGLLLVGLTYNVTRLQGAGQSLWEVSETIQMTFIPTSSVRIMRTLQLPVNQTGADTLPDGRDLPSWERRIYSLFRVKRHTNSPAVRWYPIRPIYPGRDECVRGRVHCGLSEYLYAVSAGFTTALLAVKEIPVLGWHLRVVASGSLLDLVGVVY